MTEPCFDEVVEAEDLGDTPLIVHRNADGDVAYIHSPLDATKMLVCEICYSGARVWIKPR